MCQTFYNEYQHSLSIYVDSKHSIWFGGCKKLNSTWLKKQKYIYQLTSLVFPLECLFLGGIPCCQANHHHFVGFQMLYIPWYLMVGISIKVGQYRMFYGYFMILPQPNAEIIWNLMILPYIHCIDDTSMNFNIWMLFHGISYTLLLTNIATEHEHP